MRKSVGETEHRNWVTPRFEALPHLTAYTLGGRVAGLQLRVSGLQLTELAHQEIVLGIGDGWSVEHVVVVVVLFDLVSELINARGWVGALRDTGGDGHKIPFWLW